MLVLGCHCDHTDAAFGRTENPCNERKARGIQEYVGFNTLHCQTWSAGLFQGLRSCVRPFGTADYTNLRFPGTTPIEFWILPTC